MNLAAFDFHGFIHGAGIFDFLTVSFGQCNAREAIATSCLFLGCNVLPLPDIGGDSQAGVRQRQNLPGLAHFRTVARGVLPGKLDK